MELYTRKVYSRLGRLQEELSAMCREELGRRFTLNLEHTERVKWYAPHIRHVVLDICCSATSAPADPTAARAPPARQIPGESCNRGPPFTPCTSLLNSLACRLSISQALDCCLCLMSEHALTECVLKPGESCAAGSMQGKGTEEWFWREAAPRMEPVILDGCDWGPALNT